MPKSSWHKSCKHDEYREGQERLDFDVDQTEKGEKKRSIIRVSKDPKQQEKHLSSALVELPNAGDASCLLAEGHKKRKGKEEHESFTRDDRWRGRSEGNELCYYDLKNPENSGSEMKEKMMRKFQESDRSNEFDKRKSERKGLLEEDDSNEYCQVKENARKHGSEKLKESEKGMILKEDNTIFLEHQYKVVKDKSRNHWVDKGNERQSRHDKSLKVISRNKDAKTNGSEGDKDNTRNKWNRNDDHRFQDKLQDGELEKNEKHGKKDQSDGKYESKSASANKQNLSRDVYKQQHRDEKFKEERVVENQREVKCKDERSKLEPRHKDHKYKDDRDKEEETHRDKMYKEERYRIMDSKNKEERSKKDGRYKEKSRVEDKHRNGRSSDNSREKRDEIYRNSRHRDSRSSNVRSSRDNTRYKSLEKHKEDHCYSKSRHNKNRIPDDGNTLAEHRISNYIDDNKGKKRSFEDSAKRGSEVGSFVSSVDQHRHKQIIQEKVGSRGKDNERKSPTRSSSHKVREQSRHLLKQEESSPRQYSVVSGRSKQTSEFQSVEGQGITDLSLRESSLASKEGRNFRADGRPIHFTDKVPSSSDQQTLVHNDMKNNSHDNDDTLGKVNATRNELPLSHQSSEKHRSASLGHPTPATDRFEMDIRRPFVEDNQSQIKKQRSGSYTIDNAGVHGNNWNNPLTWHLPVPNDFGYFQHGPPLLGFHSDVHQFPQSIFGMPPPMDMSHSGIPYHFHGHHDSFSHHSQPFPWHNTNQPWPHLPRMAGWDVNRNALEEYSHSYNRQEWQQEMSFSAQDTSNKPSSTQFPGQIQNKQCKVEITGIKTFDATNAEKHDIEAPSYKSEKKPGPANIKVDDSQFCNNYLKRLDISRGLSSLELYKKSIAMVGKLDPTGTCNPIIFPWLKNKKDDCGYQSKGSRNMLKPIFSEKKTSVFENAMALYRSSIGSIRSKFPASSPRPESEEVDIVEEDNIVVLDDTPMTMSDMGDHVSNNDHPHDGVDLSMSNETDLVKEPGNKEDHGVSSNIGDKTIGDNGACSDSK
ncbi:hypothetical protein GUJ93_ZPchr0008g13512 [Zizania palustris]|uniref:Uncharacterized protein n=1 Tax=Zizania palustris TaxID=103762 RepID=A0A8J5V0Y5_ZIZPA|nr:hypothetical protein GUJ93_ZPchr0008g13512 [Zizania palustris]